MGLLDLNTFTSFLYNLYRNVFIPNKSERVELYTFSDLLFLMPLLLFVVLPILLTAQQDLNLLHLWHLGQQNAINPAAAQDSTYYINIPDIAITTNYTAPKLQDLLHDQQSTQVLDIDRAIGLLDPTKNEVAVSLSAQTYRLMYNTPKWSIQQFQTTRFQADTQYPKALAQLGWEGNAPFIGQAVEVGPSFEVFSYQETGIGGSYQLGKWRLGISIKLLAGIGVATSTQSSATLTTDSDIYQLALETDYEVLAADFDNAEGSVNFGLVNLDFSDITLLSFGLPDIDFNLGAAFFNIRGGTNRGLAIDLGTVYEPNDRWRFGISVLDIGRIKWKDNAYRHKSVAANSFKGVNLGRIDFSTSEELFSFESLKDTLAEVIQFNKTATTFKTTLAAQTYIYGQYTYNTQWSFGLAAYSRFGRHPLWGGSISANYQLKRFLHIGVLYAFQENDFVNLGMHTSLQLGPFQVYAMTNNILSALDPLKETNQTAKVGMALVF